MIRYWIWLLPLLALACRKEPATEHGKAAAADQKADARLVEVLATETVADDPDDPAIWIDPEDHARSIVVATNKVEKPKGGLVVFDLQGKVLQKIGGLDRPNNVDIQQDVHLGTNTLDIAVVAERRAFAVRLYALDRESRNLSELSSLRVFEGEREAFAEPMGVAIYKRADGATFIILSRKEGPADGYLWQYRLQPGPSLALVRKFGKFSGSGEIEAVLVDDALGYVYYADETAGIRKYRADPDAVDASSELALFGQSGYQGDREGLALYTTGEKRGYIVSTDQIPHSSRYVLYRREGHPENPHDHTEVVATLPGPADSTDGIEVVSQALSQQFSRGLFVAMNSGPRNFLFFNWPEWVEGSRVQ